MTRAAVGLLLAAAGCSSPADPAAGRLTARVSYTARDSTPIQAPAWLRPCGGGRGYLLGGEDHGSGVLAWVRTGGRDSTLAGRYVALSRWDTVTARGAVVAVRFLTGDMAHGLALDSGSVVVTAGGAGGTMGATAAQIEGSGLETAQGRRVHLKARFAELPPIRPHQASDTAACQVRL